MKPDQLQPKGIILSTKGTLHGEQFLKGYIFFILGQCDSPGHMQ